MAEDRAVSPTRAEADRRAAITFQAVRELMAKHGFHPTPDPEPRHTAELEGWQIEDAMELRR